MPSVSRMDYDHLIDAETWAFIRDSAQFDLPDSGGADISAQRESYDRMCRAFFAGYPPGVSARDDHAHSVPIRIYESGPSDATLIYYHGGGFVVGGLDSHDDICAELCARTGVRVVSVDYRLAPEHVHPAAFQDAMAAARYVALTWPGSHILVGDSAGGNLAAAVAHASRRSIDFLGLVLIYPGLGGDMSCGSYRIHAHAPMLTLADVKFYDRIRHDGPGPTDDPTAAPLADSDFSNLPPTAIFTAQCDPLSDDGRAYRDAILAAGGRAHWTEEPGLVHGYLRARHSVARARDSFDRIVAATKMIAAGDWQD